VLRGEPVPRPDIPRTAQTLGEGPVLRYAILGDSTTVSQGSTYDEGYAVASARHLAQTRQVIWQNFGVSGARAADVAGEQLQKAVRFKPDVALIAVGANDVTHLTSTDSIRTSLVRTITALQKANPNVRIVLTGSPDMGSVPRLPQPTRWLAGERTISVNQMVEKLIQPQAVAFAPIARETGPLFRAHPELFARDYFHPNAAGYAVWHMVVNAALDRALR
jgi:lysophospholipase L1-like esterase